MTSEDPTKLCPYCPGEYSNLCDKHKDVCREHTDKDVNERKSLRKIGLKKCDVCGKPI